MVRDGRGKRTDVPGLRRGAEVEGGGPTGELSQVPVGVQDVSLCSILPDTRQGLWRKEQVTRLGQRGGVGAGEDA